MWISVKDRKPKAPCLTYWSDGKYEAYDINEITEMEDFFVDEDDYPWELTHWMPLPEPPENKE